MLKIVKAEFLKSAIKRNDYPQREDVEFAFFGRSNAGKSSLINFILNRRNLVKVGSTPGKTQTVNFFLIEATNSNAHRVRFILTDLPGYGYAKLAKENVKEIDAMLYEYCTNRQNLKKVFLLMDVRREATDVEKATIDFFYKLEIEPTLVLTKADKIAKTKLPNRIKEINESFKKITGSTCDMQEENNLEMLSTSTLRNYGKDEILNAIERCL